MHAGRARRRTVAVALGLLLALAMPGAPAVAARPDLPPPPRAEREVAVMTRNLYLGADLLPIFTAASEAELVGATTAAWGQVLASDFPERAAALAAEIAEHGPGLVGLQEVSLWRTGPHTAPPTPAETVALDFLDILLDALAERGLSYEAASVVETFDGQLPAFGPDGLFDVRLTDRDVILARTDLPTSQLRILDEHHARYDAALTLRLLGQPLRLDRGWTAVDVKVRGKTFRFVNTHLEAFDPQEQVRVAQTRELLAGPLATDLPVVLVGDLNSPAPGGAAYGELVTSGFADAWTLTRPGDPGFTCCQAADVRNAESLLSTRIDVVLVRGGLSARDTVRVGADPADRTASGLWPSDHAGVAATVTIPPR